MFNNQRRPSNEQFTIQSLIKTYTGKHAKESKKNKKVAKKAKNVHRIQAPGVQNVEEGNAAKRYQLSISPIKYAVPVQRQQRSIAHTNDITTGQEEGDFERTGKTLNLEDQDT